MQLTKSVQIKRNAAEEKEKRKTKLRNAAEINSPTCSERDCLFLTNRNNLAIN